MSVYFTRHTGNQWKGRNRNPFLVSLPEDVFDDVLSQIQDTYPTFDKNKYQHSVLRLEIEQLIAGDDLAEWVLTGYLFLLSAIREELEIKIDPVFLPLDSGMAHSLISTGFQDKASVILKLPRGINESTDACMKVLKEIQHFESYDYVLPNVLNGGLFEDAIAKLNFLVRTMRILDYARILDRQLAVRRMERAYENESRRQSIVDHAQTLLEAKDRNAASLTTRQTKDLRHLLYNAARNNGILPSQFYIKDVRILEKYPIGGGSYGDVYKGRVRNFDVAVKVARLIRNSEKNGKCRRDLCKEALIWKSLDHPHVLPFLGLCKEPFSSTGLVSPFMSNGPLLKYLEEHSNVDKLSLAGNICSGLDYLHRHDPEVVHGDLKCANILVDDSGNPRLADFGLARMMGLATLSSTGNMGTLRWMAPELVLPDEYGGDGRVNTSTDIYAFGMTCLELYTQEVPFHNMFDGEVVKMAQSGTALERALDIVKESWISRILRQCCSTDPNFRSQAIDILPEFFFWS